MKKILLFLLVFILIPYIVVTILTGKEDSHEFFFSSNTMVRILRTTTNEIEVVPLEEYIMGVLAGEMPLSFELEALKAQAVASRSYVMYHMLQNKNENYDVVDTTKHQVYIDSDTLRKKWGSKYDEYANKIIAAVLSTSYEYIVYNNKVAEALFFSTSTGYTENSEEVFPSKRAYLRSVESPWDNISPAFNEANEFTLEQFLKKLNLKSADSLKIEVIEATSTGRIKRIRINEKKFTGSQVYSALSLRSTFFTIKQDKNKVSVTTKGFGHGVGMSQYGAQGMAVEGYSYDEILKHYYTGIEIKKIKN